jgi:hypothetical protein
MTIDQVRRLHSARPFHAFELYLADSRTLTVQHPEQLAISPSGRTIHIAHADDTAETIDLLLIVSLKPRPNSALRRRRPRS